MLLVSLDVLLVSLNHALYPSGGSHFPWWAGLVLGLSIALIVSIILCAVAAVYLVRLRRRNSDLISQRDVESAKVGVLWLPHLCRALCQQLAQTREYR